MKKNNPALYEKVRSGEVKLRDTSKLTKKNIPPKDLKTRYSEKDFYRRIGTGLAGAFGSVEERLDELTRIKRADWTPEAADGLQKLIKNLNEVAERADDYASKFKTILKANKKVA